MRLERHRSYIKDMRILIFNSWYYPNMKGGAEQSVKLLAENLSLAGHNVAVVSADGTDDIVTQEDINGISVFRIKTYLPLSTQTIFDKIIRKQKELCDTSNKNKIVQIIKKFQPDIIHTNSLSGFSFTVWQFIAEMNIPIVHTIRDYSLCSPRGVYENYKEVRKPYAFYLRYYADRARKASRYVTYATAPSEYTLQLLEKNGYFTNISNMCVPNAIEYDQNLIESRIATRISTHKQNKNIMFAGRLLEIKGIKLLVDAFKLISQANEDIYLIICGEGELAGYVEENCKHNSHIIYKGQLTKAELEAQYLEADVVVFPSLWDEPFGRIVIEANSYGVPIVTTHRGGIPEIMDAIGGGEIIEEETPESLAGTIIKVLRGSRSEYYQNIIKNIHKYGIKEQIKTFTDIYNILIG